ncbi:MAG: hypothetical protein AAF726_18210 [Planctomycetota bacterium]
MTALVDVVFLILIFTMSTTEFRSLECAMRADLPRDVGYNQLGPGSESLVVGMYVLPPRWPGDEQRRLHYRVGMHFTTSLVKAERRMRRYYRAAPERYVCLAPQTGVTTQEALTMLDLLLTIGFDDIGVGGAPRD